MVVNHAHSLEKAVDDRGTNEGEAAMFQVFAQAVGQIGAGG
jgi:hypothetical protein